MIGPLVSEARGYLAGGPAGAPNPVLRFGAVAGVLWVGAAEAEIDEAGLWSPAAGGRAVLTLPVAIWRTYPIGGDTGGTIEARRVVDLLALDPDNPDRWWRRSRSIEFLGRLGGEARGARIYSTPLAWLEGACADFAARAAACGHAAGKGSAFTPAPDWRPGEHGLCALEPSHTPWLDILAGRKSVTVDRPAFGKWLSQRLKDERKRAMPKLPKIEIVGVRR